MTAPEDTSRLIALRALIAAGATDSLEGKVARELVGGPAPQSAPDDIFRLTALRALIAAGASDALVGKATRELFGAPTPQASPAPRAETQNTPRSPARAASAAKSAATESLPEPPIVMYRKRSGERSSVSVKPALWAALLQHAPESDLKTQILSFAEKAPADVKTSAWVAEQLQRRYLGK